MSSEQEDDNDDANVPVAVATVEPTRRWCKGKKLCRSKVLWLLGFLIVFGGAIIREITFAVQDCSSESMKKRDSRWVSRGTLMFLGPLFFALTMEEWPTLGNFLRLSFHANERSPPRFCRLESMVPALLVGLGMCNLVLCFPWLPCAPFEACMFGLVGVVVLLLGFGCSRYLRGTLPWGLCNRSNEVNGEATTHTQTIQKKRSDEVPPTMLRQESPVGYDQEDHILGHIAGPRANSSGGCRQPAPIPTQPQNALGESGTVPRTLSLGVFDRFDDETIFASIPSQYDSGRHDRSTEFGNSILEG